MVTRGVNVRDLRISDSWAIVLPNRTTPEEDERQRVIFLCVVKESKTCEVKEVRVLPRPNMPLAPLAKPFKSMLGEHVKRIWCVGSILLD